MQKIRISLTFIAVMTIVFSQCAQFSPSATLILKNGIIVTVDEAFSVHEAVAVRKDRIIRVGSNDDLARLESAGIRVIDLQGALVLPGLIDSHAHIYSLGEELSIVNISGAASFAEVVERVAVKVGQVQSGEWIFGGRWDHTMWRSADFPVHDALSRVSPDNPVYLRRVDGNSALVNAKALSLAGITKSTPEPFGGSIIRKRNGEPTGVLINRAMNLVKDLFPEETVTQYKTKVIAALKRCERVGLTSIHEAGIGPAEIESYKQLIDNDQIDVRIYAMLGEQEVPVLEMDDEEMTEYFKKHRLDNYSTHRLSVRSIKLFFDGALGSRGAAFYHPYTDDASNRGLLRITPEYITRVSRAALNAGMGVNTHCIGTRGNGLCLDAYQKAFDENSLADHRFRIEHAQIVRNDEFSRFKDLGVIPAMQPTHCTSDMRFVEERVGRSRAEGAYAWRSFIEAGMMIPCGSDFPVESNNPLLGIYAAITRQDTTGYPSGGWFPEQRMTVEEAIKGFTIWSAYAAFQEDDLGSIQQGKLADFTVLDHNILECPPSEILKTRVTHTIIGGKIVYQRGKVD